MWSDDVWEADVKIGYAFRGNADGHAMRLYNDATDDRAALQKNLDYLDSNTQVRTIRLAQYTIQNWLRVSSSLPVNLGFLLPASTLLDSRSVEQTRCHLVAVLAMLHQQWPSMCAHSTM